MLILGQPPKVPQFVQIANGPQSGPQNCVVMSFELPVVDPG